MAKSKDEKLAEQFIEALSNHYFDTPGFANKLVTFAPHYTIDKLVQVIEHIILFGYHRQKQDWENNSVTSPGLITLRDWKILLDERNI